MQPQPKLLLANFSSLEIHNYTTHYCLPDSVGFGHLRLLRFRRCHFGCRYHTSRAGFPFCRGRAGRAIVVLVHNRCSLTKLKHSNDRRNRIDHSPRSNTLFFSFLPCPSHSWERALSSLLPRAVLACFSSLSVLSVTPLKRRVLSVSFSVKKELTRKTLMHHFI